MSKKLTEVVLGLYRAIFKDCSTQFPSKARELGKVLARLSSLVEHRGLRVVTIDFPDGGKFLERSLERGFVSTDFPHVLGYPCPAGPRLFLALFELIFNETGVLRGDYSIEAVFFLRQIFYAVKKLEMECSDERLYSTTDEYSSTEGSLPNPVLNWAGDELLSDNSGYLVRRRLHVLDAVGVSERPDSSSPELKLELVAEDAELTSALRTTQQVFDRVASSFGCVDFASITGRHGPGAVSDATSKDWKYQFPLWGDKLERVFPLMEHGLPFPDPSLLTQEGSELIPGFVPWEGYSKLISVPKTQKAPRLIAAEPTAHQWMQQGVTDWFRQKIAKSAISSSIDFLDQEPSRSACLRASKDRASATVDLSEASDRLSCWLVERAFRSNLDVLDMLHATRTRLTFNPIDKRVEKLMLLRKFAPMGSAVTFPIQTIIFTMVACAAVISSEGSRVSVSTIRRASARVRVYGDDIIVPASAYLVLVQLLTSLFLKVNEAKSFVKGPFRESCGMDAVGGYEVTPAYFRKVYKPNNPESVMAVIESSNNFHKCGCWTAAEYVLSLVPEKITRRLPAFGPRRWSALRSRKGNLWLGESLGVSSFSGDSVPPGKRRWNELLHRHEVRALDILTKVKRTTMDSCQSLLQWFTEAPAPELLMPWASGQDSRPIYTLVNRWVPDISSGWEPGGFRRA